MQIIYQLLRVIFTAKDSHNLITAKHSHSISHSLSVWNSKDTKFFIQNV
jgi:hypothetical protein